MKMRLATPALVLVGILAFAACGGDDDGGSVLGRPSTTVKGSAAASSDETNATATDDTTSDTDTTVADDSSSIDDTDSSVTVDTSFSGKGSGDFCSFAKDIEKNVNLDSLGEADSDPATIKKEFQQGRQLIDEAVGKAPAEIKDDVKTLSQFIDKFADLLAGYDYDFTKLAADAQAHPEKFAEFEQLTSDPNFAAATERFDAYLQNVCKIDTGSGG